MWVTRESKDTPAFSIADIMIPQTRHLVDGALFCDLLTQRYIEEIFGVAVQIARTTIR
jgi:hypothetical protein